MDEPALFRAASPDFAAAVTSSSSDRMDATALEEARREAEATERRLLGPVARAGAAQTKARLENARHNAGVIGQQEDALRAERKAARRLIEEMHE